ncbi:MAG: hypothetical protein LUC44_04910 [Prevotellaceae bacterium]|nr:hypothetical protein [Prevotellaceae bacterium]
MRSLAEELLEYYDNSSEQQRRKDWATIHKEFAYGIEVGMFIGNLREQVSQNYQIKVNPSIPEE